MATKVRAGSWYVYQPCMLDRIDAQAIHPSEGDRVKVVNMRGCPPANTMGHAYVQDSDGEFRGLVSTTSLVKASR